MQLNIKEKTKEIEQQKIQIERLKNKSIVWEAFKKDAGYRLSWNSNSIEGNTLSLAETVAVIDYDQVQSGHTYTEYTEAKSVYRAVQQMLSFDKPQTIHQAWIHKVNSIIMQNDGAYRTEPVFIGSLAEAIYYPPNAEEIPSSMDMFEKNLQENDTDIAGLIKQVSKQHIQFERIHPFSDGNGRTGRMILNQQLLNAGLLPAIIKNQSKYGQAFRRYDKNSDTLLMEYTIASGILESLNILMYLDEKFEKV